MTSMALKAIRQDGHRRNSRIVEVADVRERLDRKRRRPRVGQEDGRREIVDRLDEDEDAACQHPGLSCGNVTSAISTPPVSARRLIAPITGPVKRSSAATTSSSYADAATTPGAAHSSPAVKARPAPVRMRTRIWIGFKIVDCRGDSAPHPDRQRVELVGPAQHDGRVALVGPLDQDRLVRRVQPRPRSAGFRRSTIAASRSAQSQPATCPAARR